VSVTAAAANRDVRSHAKRLTGQPLKQALGQNAFERHNPPLGPILAYCRRRKDEEQFAPDRRDKREKFISPN
jgi:hypothetical protein